MRTENKDKELNHRHFIGVRLTDVELNLLDQGAASFSISRSEYVRKLLLEKQIYHQVEVVADMNDLKKLVTVTFIQTDRNESQNVHSERDMGKNIWNRHFCTKIQLPSFMSDRICDWSWISRQMSKPCRVRLMLVV